MWPALACAVVATVAVLAGCGGTGGPGPSSAATSRPEPSDAAAVSHPCGQRAHPVRRVAWIVLENHSYSDIIGSAHAPYLNHVAASCGLATNFTAEAHPSLPNYIAMTSGATQGIGDDDDPSAHRLTVPSIFSQLGGHWRALQESMPRACALADAGSYAVRHNPATYYIAVRRACARQDLPLRGLPALSARFTFVTPNLCDDMHSCPVRAGDRWIAGWLPSVLRSAAYRSGSMAIFITWDEDDGASDQHIPTIVMSAGTRPGTRSATPFNHYSLLRTTEEILGLPDRLGAAATARSMRTAYGLG
ncbi:MAG TPA: alkaline phosphatase family protein [Baekduia sp.]